MTSLHLTYLCHTTFFVPLFGNYVASTYLSEAQWRRQGEAAQREREEKDLVTAAQLLTTAFSLCHFSLSSGDLSGSDEVVAMYIERGKT